MEHPFRHHSIVVYTGVGTETLFLYLPGSDNPFANDGTRFARLHLAELCKRNGLYLAMNVDAVEQRATDFVQVLHDLSGCAAAVFVGMVVVAARTGVHRGDEHEGARIVDGIFGS